jgi:hypothetical protein
VQTQHVNASISPDSHRPLSLPLLRTPQAGHAQPHARSAQRLLTTQPLHKSITVHTLTSQHHRHHIKIKSVTFSRLSLVDKHHARKELALPRASHSGDIAIRAHAHTLIWDNDELRITINRLGNARTNSRTCLDSDNECDRVLRVLSGTRVHSANHLN